LFGKNFFALEIAVGELSTPIAILFVVVLIKLTNLPTPQPISTILLAFTGSKLNRI
jgi:hypothetical protein